MPQNTAKARTTESPREGPVARGDRGRGRPPGSKNKPKSLVPTELADAILVRMEDVVPPEHFKYLKGVIKDGKAIATKSELDTLILLLSRNLYPALVDEMDGEDHVEVDGEQGTVVRTHKRVVFRKDVTERLKVLNSLLTLRSNIEKREEGEKDGDQPILRLYADRAIAGRVAVLVGGVPGPVVGDVDEPKRLTDGTRTVSGEVLERPEPLPVGEQG